MYYIGLIHKDDDSCYGISFPDFPGCISAGETLDEVMQHGAEALDIHIAGMLDDGTSIPAPQSLEDVTRNSDGFWIEDLASARIVHVPYIENAARTKTVNISFDAGLLAGIDAAARRRKMTRSAFIASAARKEIA